MKATPDLLAVYRRCVEQPEGPSEAVDLFELEGVCEVYDLPGGIGSLAEARKRLAADLAEMAEDGDFHDLAAVMAAGVDSRWQPFSVAVADAMEAE